MGVVNKRMFVHDVISSDDFLDMPLETQALYFQLSMNADNEGFINRTKKIMKTLVNGTDTMESMMRSFRRLIDEGFIHQFESGVVVIMDWNVNNQLKVEKGRYAPSFCKERELVGCNVNKDTGTKYGRYWLLNESQENQRVKAATSELWPIQNDSSPLDDDSFEPPF